VGLAPEDGLPVGLQVMAPPLADDRLYRVGAALEAALESDWGGPLLDRIFADRSRNADVRDREGGPETGAVR
jgi:aspartyl-tRNA(Asn)/glutamyl-tRNA(Gln) amidotransferase subunit A